MPGYDVAHGLHGLGGQIAALERVLRTFVDTYAGGEPALRGTAGADAAQQLARWRGAAHSLRGACATVGAAALQRHLQAFDDGLRAGVAPPMLAEQALQIDAGLVALVARLAQALDG